MWKFFALILGMCVVAGLPAQAQQRVITLRPLSDKDTRYVYPEILLKEILKVTEESYGEAILVRAKSTFSRERTKLVLKTGTLLHVMAEAPKPGWEEDLLPVRIPIRKGIQGYRLFLIDKRNQAALGKVETLKQLMKYSTGSGAQWSTRRVMEEAGFKVATGPDYEGLFRMLMAGRFITFGRGINEIYSEYEAHSKQFPNMAIENQLAVFIPLPTYFFVSPTKPELAKRIEEGLNTLITNGDFDKIFWRHNRTVIEAANLKERRIFKLPNPNLGAMTPLDVKAYWYTP
jgi:hypothetical protein